MFSAAFPLALSVFDAYWRAAWANQVAQDEEIDRFVMGRFDPAPDTVLKAPRVLDPEFGATLSRIKADYWKFFSDYAHGGSRQFQSWFTTKSSEGPQRIGAVHSDVEIVFVYKFTTGLALAAAGQLQELTGQDGVQFLIEANRLFQVEPEEN